MFSSAVCAAAFGAWLMATTWAFALTCAFVCGMGAAVPLHPLAKAEAFAVLPSRPGLVNSASFGGGMDLQSVPVGRDRHAAVAVGAQDARA